MNKSFIYIALSVLLLTACLKKIGSLNEEDVFSTNYKGDIWFEQSSVYSTSFWDFYRIRIKNYQLGNTETPYTIQYKIEPSDDYIEVFKQEGDVFTLRLKQIYSQDNPLKVHIAILSSETITSSFFMQWNY